MDIHRIAYLKHFSEKKICHRKYGIFKYHIDMHFPSILRPKIEKGRRSVTQGSIWNNFL